MKGHSTDYNSDPQLNTNAILNRAQTARNNDDKSNLA